MLINIPLRVLRFIDRDSSALKKDRILSAINLRLHEECDIIVFAQHISQPVHITNYYCSVLSEDGLIDVIPVTTKSGLRNELLINGITDKGIVFLAEGGYTRREYSRWLRESSTVLVAVITTINAIVSTVIAYMAYNVADDTKKLNKILEDKNRIVDSTNKALSGIAIQNSQLQTRVDSMKKAVKVRQPQGQEK